jgi:PhzF family phenazine biosynthesis protein
MTLPIYQIDAFTNKLFGGNPAAIVPLKEWISDELMQKISMENNVSDTGFFVPSIAPDSDFEIRWFTPANEINLCGHATLAAAFLLFNYLGFKKSTVTFNSPSGPLIVAKNNNLLTMDFPSWKPRLLDSATPKYLLEALGIPSITGLYQHRDLLVEVDNESVVKNSQPDFSLMKKHFDKIIITAPGDQADFVSRFYGPAFGVDEDPVTGSAHSQLIPFWSERLGKSKMKALQLSSRGGELWCEQVDEKRVLISGECVFYMKGEIEV